MAGKLQYGTILITVLIVLFILIVSVLTHIENNRTHLQSASLFRDHMLAFYQAERALRVGEASLNASAKILWLQPKNELFKKELIATDSCGKKRYRISAEARVGMAYVSLYSIYDILTEPSALCRGEKINRRIYWSRDE